MSKQTADMHATLPPCYPYFQAHAARVHACNPWWKCEKALCAAVHRTCMFNPSSMSRLSRPFGSHVSASLLYKRVENSESAHRYERRRTHVCRPSCSARWGTASPPNQNRLYAWRRQCKEPGAGERELRWRESRSLWKSLCAAAFHNGERASVDIVELNTNLSVK